MENEENILIDQGAKKASIHTANEDISRALSGTSAKIVKETIDDALEKEEIRKEETLSSGKNKVLFFATLLFFIGSAGFFVWGIQKKDRSITIDPLVSYQGIITYDQTKNMGDFEQKGTLLLQKYKDAMQQVTTDGITRFRFNNVDPVSTKTLIDTFGWKPGNKFQTGLTNAFDFGVYHSKDKNYPFILFKTIGTDQSFAGFSLWEDGILFDLGDMFSVNAQTAYDPIYQKKFEPITIESHDGRVLYDVDGNPLLIMIFLDENHALVTNSREAVAKILERVILKK